MVFFALATLHSQLLFFSGFGAALRDRVAMLHVYQNRSLPYANDMAILGKAQPRRVQYRVGLGVTVSLLLASAVGLVAWASFTNTHQAIVDLTDEQVREILTGLDLRVREHLQGAVTAAQLSEKLLSNAVLRDNQDVLARHFTEVLRANPSFAWASYSDAMGDFTGAYRAPDGSLHISQTTLKSSGRVHDYTVGEGGAWERHYEQIANDYDPRDEAFYRAATRAGKLIWIGPVIFYDEGIPGITCANPRFAKDGSLLGVLTVDINVNFLSEFIGNLHFGKHGKVFIFDNASHVIAFPGLQLVENAGQGTQGKLLTEADVADPVFQAFAVRKEGLAEEQFTVRQGGQELRRRIPAPESGRWSHLVSRRVCPGVGFPGSARGQRAGRIHHCGSGPVDRPALDDDPGSAHRRSFGAAGGGNGGSGRFSPHGPPTGKDHL